MTGKVCETLVAVELLKHATWAEQSVRAYHYQRERQDIDFVLETNAGDLAAVEVKGASRVPARELRGLFKLRRRLGRQFLGGVVLYTGTQAYAHPDGIYVAPISRLWHGGIMHE